jgi:hypothetical protein
MTGAAAVTLLTALPALREPPAVSLEPSPAPSPA